MSVAGRLRAASPALKFVLLVGVMSFFADFAWVLSSIAIGLLFTVSLRAVTAFTVAAQLAAVPLLQAVRRQRQRRESIS